MIDIEDCEPKLAEILGVKAEERFKFGPNIYFVRRNGVLYQQTEENRYKVAGCTELCMTIGSPEYIEKLCDRKWYKDDVEDAKAVRRIFPEVTDIVKQGGTINFGYFPDDEIFEDENGNETMKDIRPAVTMSVPETSKLFSSVSVGERVKLDDILG